MRSWSGPTPSSGLMAPPSTWYRPRNSPVRSIATTSFGSSTTQSTSFVRRGSRQTRHCSDSATLKQVVQNRTSSFTLRSAVASRLTSAGSADRTWKAIRWALLGPTPGSRPSSSIRSWMAPSYTCSEPREAEAAETAGGRPHLRLGELALRLGGIPDRGEHQVLQRLDVVGVDRLRIDPHRLDLAEPRHQHGHQATTGGAGHLGGGQLGLRLRDLLLHLLRLLHDLLHVRLSTGAHATAPQLEGHHVLSAVGTHPAGHVNRRPA